MSAQSHTGHDAAGPHIVCIMFAPERMESQISATPDDDRWLAACYRVTGRVERIASHSALLDLGICTGAEALAVTHGLVDYLAGSGLRMRAGIAPTPALAQLAILAAPKPVTLASLAPQDVVDFLRRTPVELLASLHPQGIITIEVVNRLRHYGLSTLGHIARLDEMTLRRQFGKAGVMLYALAHGTTESNLHPAPPPEERTFRLRLASPLSPGAIQPMLIPWTKAIAAQLRQERRQARELRLLLHWESGSWNSARLVLRQHTSDQDVLRWEIWRLLLPRIAHGTSHLITDLRLTLRDFAPDVPEQSAFWRIRRQRLAEARTIGATLARRHGHPVVYMLRQSAPDAIFTEDRHTLTPTGTGEPSPVTHAHGTHVFPPDAWEDVPQRIHWW